MKKFAKILSAGLSALMLMSVPCMTAGAVSENSFPATAIAASLNHCDLSACGDIQSLLCRIPCGDTGCDTGAKDQPFSPDQLLGYGNLTMDSLMELLQQGQTCPGGDCDKTPSQSTPDSDPETPSQPTPAIPSEEPETPAEESQMPDEKPDTTPSADSSFRTAYEEEVIRLVNVERAKYGLPALQKDGGATSVAHIRAKEIVQSFSHTRPNGSSCFTAANELGVSYSTAGENIAYGYADPQQVVNGWMNSEGHRKNILSSSFSKIGVGCYANGNVLYWSQFFIG